VESGATSTARMTIAAPGICSLGRRHSTWLAAGDQPVVWTRRGPMAASVSKEAIIDQHGQMVHPHSHTAQALSTAFVSSTLLGLRCGYTAGMVTGVSGWIFPKPLLLVTTSTLHGPCLCQRLRSRTHGDVPIHDRAQGLSQQA
jgi:hypothetical protein